jgi:hypothetical protein
MQEVPCFIGFLAFPGVAATPSRVRNASAILALVVNGSEAFAVTRRDKDATWQSLGSLGWSKPRALFELENGLPYRTFPPGHKINWHDANVRRSLDVQASTVTLIGMVGGGGVTGFHYLTVGIEVLSPIHDEVASADIPQATTAEWAVAKTRRLLDDDKIPEGILLAELARLLEAEAPKDVRAGRLRHAPKASYLENQLGAWGIWPLSSFK